MGANVLFDQVYARWTLFNTIIGAVTGFVAYLVLEANGPFRTLFDDRVNLTAGRGTSTSGCGRSSEAPPGPS